ncbi:hypothetical protein CYMTET_19147 [Cymbomonas tetramitiformis]|uniref:Serine/threonine-protein kinase RIO1 n=1 Tax=Cymbomonas tetramitiformis TaxID=36881 RepID=A0AAE0G6N6_9CHLO|nr:hypothetical protein CYMTET_19147 [Cymbomonas tetramitiformis]
MSVPVSMEDLASRYEDSDSEEVEATAQEKDQERSQLDPVQNRIAVLKLSESSTDSAKGAVKSETPCPATTSHISSGEELATSTQRNSIVACQEPTYAVSPEASVDQLVSLNTEESIGQTGADEGPTVSEEGAYEEVEWYDEEDYDEEDEDDEILGAFDAVDAFEDMAARGIGGEGMGSGISTHAWKPNAHGGVATQGKNLTGAAKPSASTQKKLESRLNVNSKSSQVSDLRLPSSVSNTVRETERKEALGKLRVSDKSDRATVEQALDPRTRMVLFKMLSRGVMSEVNGCISTGKEANVYHAITAAGDSLAIKVFKTSILVFKDRDRYVSGDFRFRNGYGKGNPRKMVKTWAEKEMRNLIRMRNCGMNVPRVEMLRMHVLVMEFIGKDGWPAPRLKDAQLTEARLRGAYREVVEAMWVMYQKCKLVHADLSEYNMLYCDGHVVIIDVSQAVDLDHPRALVFLREDCAHVNAFFAQKNKVCTLSTRELFDFVTDPTITEANMEEVLDQLCAVAAERPAGALSAEDQLSEAVFRGAFIPQNLSEVVDFERDASKLASASGKEVEGIYYTTLTGMKVADGDLTVRQTPELLTVGTQGIASGAGIHVKKPEDSASAQGGGSAPADEGAVKLEGAADGKEKDEDEDEDEDEDGDEDGEGSSDEEVEGGEGADEARRRARKEHKKLVKAEKAEKRKTKIPKSEKKRKTKANKKK